MSRKNRVISDEGCFTKDRVVRDVVKTSLQVTEILKLRSPLLSIGISSVGFSFYEHSNSQFTYEVFYIQNRNVCLRKMILHQYFVVFYPAWEASPLKKFYM